MTKRELFDDRYEQTKTGAVSGEPRCLRCSMPTPTKILSHYGGRCDPCYEAFCAQPLGDVAPQRQPARYVPAEPEEGLHELERRRQAAKAETAKRVAEYAKRNGLQA